MKKSELTNSIKEEIFEILSEETADDISAKTSAQAELNKELEKTAELTKEGDDKIKDLESQLDFHTQMDNKGRASIIKAKIEKLRKLSNSGKIDGDEFLDKFNPLSKELKSLDESLNPEVSRDVNRYIARTAKRYGYSEQDAVYAIMAALKQRDFDGVNEAEDMDDVEMDKKAAKAAKKGDSISKIANKLRETDSQMKSIVKKWKDSEEPEKSKLLTRLKELTKIKKELEGLL